MKEINTRMDALPRAKGLFRTGDFESAERILKQAVQADPKNCEARLLLGQAYFKLDRFDQAISAFAGLLALENDNVEALLQLGILYRLKNRPEDAITALDRAIKLAPQKSELHYHLGMVLRQVGKFMKARENFERAIELNPNEVLAYNALGTVLGKLGRPEEAIEVLWKGLQADPNNPSLHYNYGQNLEALGRMDEALSEYETAVKIRPSWQDAVNTLGMAYNKTGASARAIEIFNRLISQNPKNLEARINLGEAFSQLGRTDEAVTAFRGALEIDQGSTRAALGLESLLEKAGALTDALDQLLRLEKVVPDNEEVKYHLGRLYFSLGYFPEAIGALRAILSTNARNLQALRLLGSVYLKSGNPKAARECFSRLLAADPTALEFRLDLAEIHKQAGDFNAALGEVKAYLEQRPEDPKARLELGRIYAARGNDEHALQIFKEQVQRHPSDAEALTELSKHYQKMGNREKAVQIMDSLINLRGQRGNSEDIDVLNESLKQYETAVKAYSKDVRESWNRNLRILKNVMQQEQRQADEALAGAQSTEEMPPILNLGGEKVIAVDESAEMVFLDEREEELAEDDFFDGEMGTDETPEEEDEEVADTYINIPDVDQKPLDKLLTDQDLYADHPEKLKPREDSQLRAAEPEPRPQQQAQQPVPPQFPQYPSEAPEWLKDMAKQPQYPQYPPFPQYPPYQPYQPQQPYQQDQAALDAAETLSRQRQALAEERRALEELRARQSQEAPLRLQDMEPDEGPTTNPAQKASPQPGPEDSYDPLPDEIDLDMLDTLEDDFLDQEKDIEDLMEESDLEAPAALSPEEGSEPPLEDFGDIGSSLDDELQSLDGEGAEEEINGLSDINESEEGGIGEDVGPEGLGPEDGAAASAETQGEAGTEAGASGLENEEDIDGLLDEEIQEAFQEDDDDVFFPPDGPPPAIGQDIGEDIGADIDEELEIAEFGVEPMDLEEESEDIFDIGLDDGGDEILDLAPNDIKAPRQSLFTLEEEEDVFGQPTLKLLEYLKNLTRELPDHGLAGQNPLEAEKKLDELIHKISATTGIEPELSGDLQGERRDSLPARPKTGSPDSPALAKPESSRQPLAEWPDDELQIYSESRRDPVLSVELPEPGFNDEEAERLVAELEQAQKQGPKKVPPKPEPEKAGTQGIPISAKMARLLDIMKREKGKADGRKP